MKISLNLFACLSFLSSIHALSQEGIRHLAERTLQNGGGWTEGGGSWQQNPPSQQPFTLVELGGQIDGSVMAYRVNQNDPRVGQDTISIVYQVPTLAWLAIGFSGNGGNMVGSEAVIAVPETGEILKYNLGGKSLQGVQPMPANQQTLVEKGLLQEQGVTTFAFTKIMNEPGEVPIVTNDVNIFLGAWGSGNALGIHAVRQPFSIDLTNGVVENVVPPIAQAPPPVENPPAAAGEPIALGGQLEGAEFAFVINSADPRAGGQDTITIEYTIPVLAWAGVAISDNGGFMVGSEAVIGVPETGEVLKYNLNSKSVAGVVPMGDAQQTLIDASIIQDGDSTTLTFTKIMVEQGEISISDGANTFLGAWGFDNGLGIHAAREPFELDFNNLEGGVVQAPPPDNGGGDGGDVAAPAAAGEPIDLVGQLEGSEFSFTINSADPNAGGQDTITIEYTVPVLAWAGIAFSDNGGFMIGSEAVIGVPETGEVLKYNLNAKNDAGVVPMGDAQQTLIDASITQDGDSTTLTFTKIMAEQGEVEISNAENIFLGAWGFANNLGIHAARESFALNLANLGDGVGGVDVRKQSYWAAHGLIAGIAWGILSPLAIGASVVRQLFKGPLWFKIHRGLNMLVVLSTVVAFILAVVAINQETPEGVKPTHFPSSPNPHRLIGLVIFIIALVQALLGIFRPHATEPGETKTTTRFAWEVAHKVLGYACLGMAIYQVQSGIKIYGNIFDQGENALIVFWTMICVIGGGVVCGFVGIKFFGFGATDDDVKKSTKSAGSEKEGTDSNGDVQEQPGV